VTTQVLRRRSPRRPGGGDLLLDRVEIRRAEITPAPDHAADLVQVGDRFQRVGIGTPASSSTWVRFSSTS
jgi:hypothetical protein